MLLARIERVLMSGMDIKRYQDHSIPDIEELWLLGQWAAGRNCCRCIKRHEYILRLEDTHKATTRMIWHAPVTESY
jgi:hypothetical protein